MFGLGHVAAAKVARERGRIHACHVMQAQGMRAVRRESGVASRKDMLEVQSGSQHRRAMRQEPAQGGVQDPWCQRAPKWRGGRVALPDVRAELVGAVSEVRQGVGAGQRLDKGQQLRKAREAPLRGRQGGRQGGVGTQGTPPLKGSMVRPGNLVRSWAYSQARRPNQQLEMTVNDCPAHLNPPRT